MGVGALREVDHDLQPLLLSVGEGTTAPDISEWSDAGLTVRFVRGRKMRTISGLFDEFAAAFQFPLYFGENKGAFEECVEDLEGLRPGRGFVIVLTEPNEFLVDADDADFLWFVEVLRAASDQWAQPIELGEQWDRPPVPFHVVLTGASAILGPVGVRWSSAGVVPTVFRAG